MIAVIKFNPIQFRPLRYYFKPNYIMKKLVLLVTTVVLLFSCGKKEKEGEEEVQPVPTMAMGTQTTLGQLNVPGADQLRALIAADMEEERLEAEGHPDIVDAEIVSETIRTPEVTQTTE